MSLPEPSQLLWYASACEGKSQLVNQSHWFLTFCKRTSGHCSCLYLMEESFAAHVHRRPIMLTPLNRSLMFLPRVMFPESHVYPRLGEVREFKAETILRSFQWSDKHIEYNPVSNIMQPKLVGQPVSYSNMWTSCCSFSVPWSNLKRCWSFSRYFLLDRHSCFLYGNVFTLSYAKMKSLDRFRMLGGQN